MFVKNFTIDLKKNNLQHFFNKIYEKKGKVMVNLMDKTVRYRDGRTLKQQNWYCEINTKYQLFLQIVAKIRVSYRFVDTFIISAFIHAEKIQLLIYCMLLGHFLFIHQYTYIQLCTRLIGCEKIILIAQSKKSSKRHLK